MAIRGRKGQEGQIIMTLFGIATSVAKITLEKGDSQNLSARQKNVDFYLSFIPFYPPKAGIPIF